MSAVRGPGHTEQVEPTWGGDRQRQQLHSVQLVAFQTGGRTLAGAAMRQATDTTRLPTWPGSDRSRFWGAQEGRTRTGVSAAFPGASGARALPRVDHRSFFQACSRRSCPGPSPQGSMACRPFLGRPARQPQSEASGHRPAHTADSPISSIHTALSSQWARWVDRAPASNPKASVPAAGPPPPAWGGPSVSQHLPEGRVSLLCLHLRRGLLRPF